MIRVIYRWNVAGSDTEAFTTEWQRLTGWIRDEFDGSYGSTLLAPNENQHSLVGVARWASLTHLQTFRDEAGSLHLPGAELMSMEILTEISSMTTED